MNEFETYVLILLSFMSFMSLVQWMYIRWIYTMMFEDRHPSYRSSHD